MESMTPAVYEALLNGPALAPPLGVIPNFANPNTLSVYVVPTIVLAIIFSTMALVMRIVTQRAIGRPLYWEDYVAILAYFLFIGWCAPNIIAARHGGKHQWDTRLEELFSMLYWSNLVQILYGPVIFTVKLSLLLQYYRIFVPSRKRNMRMFVGISIIFFAHLTFYIIDTFFQIFLCYPREKAWNKLIEYGHCYSLPATYVSSGVVNVASDFALLGLPIYAVWKLRITLKQKIQVSCAFATGLVVCVASVGRTVYIIKLFRTKDQTRAIIAPGLCGIAEVSLGLICSCLPTMPMFFNIVAERLPLISICGFKLFGTKTQTTALSTTRSENYTSNKQGWKEGEDGINRFTKGYHELEDWQLTPRKGELLTQISSMGKKLENESSTNLEGGASGIVKRVEIDVAEGPVIEKDLRGRSYFDDV